MIRAALAAAAIVVTMHSASAETVLLHAAGSLSGALSEVVKAFEAASGHKVQTRFGASGLLRDEIAAGAKAQVFASANMEHPRALSTAGKSGPVTMFARNTLCALVKPGFSVDSASLLERMLDPSVKVGTSTPKADPSGDYAFEVFTRAEAIKAGARAALEGKALKLTGAADSAKPADGRNVYGWNVAEGRADLFLTYCTNAVVAKRQNPDQQIVQLPANLAVGADYGLTVMKDAPPEASALAQFILSSQGQQILNAHGFAPPR